MSYLRLLEHRISVSDFDPQDIMVFTALKSRFSDKDIISFGLEDLNYFTKSVCARFGLRTHEVRKSLALLEEEGIISYEQEKPSFLKKLFRRASIERVVETHLEAFQRLK